MKKQKLINQLKFGIILLCISLLFANCESENIPESEISQLDYIHSTKEWFENNPELNNFTLLDFAKKIDWRNAKYFEKENNIVVEVPIILKQNFFLTTNKSSVSTNRLLFYKTNNGEYYSRIINISSSKNNFELINDLTKINYYNIPSDFTGNFLVLKSNDKKASINFIIDGKLKIIILSAKKRLFAMK